MNKSKFISASLLVLVVIITTIGFTLISQKSFSSKKIRKKYEAGHRRFGKKDMMFYTEAMSSGVSFKDPSRLEGDKYASIDFDAKITPNNCIVLVDLYKRPETYDYSSDGNTMMVRLNASKKHQHGKVLKKMYEDAISNTYSYSLHEGELLGLKRYVAYRRSGDAKPAFHDEYLITMKNEVMPLRLLQVDSYRHLGTGQVYHYFMYNDWVQVKIYYRKIYLKDWQRIETAMRQFIDTLYAETQQHDILYYSDTSNAITRHCPKGKL